MAVGALGNDLAEEAGRADGAGGTNGVSVVKIGNMALHMNKLFYCASFFHQEFKNLSHDKLPSLTLLKNHIHCLHLHYV